ncbi:hypothetical protein ACQR1W_14730 [Bradyrhizobium sp. HKCCYLS1011]|uniref:hypothetical protein n=1 Tax=Bradyrhizobium sp. HKCCYLS1011 TaxID=3420733 RepID=UPI003EBF034D
MKALALFLICLGVALAGSTSQDAFFVPFPSSLAPVAEFGCPDPGTVFTYDVPAWNTNRPNRMVAIERDQLNCRIRSDAQGVYDWYGGVGPHLRDEDLAQKQLIANIWPLRTGYSESVSKYGSPWEYSEIKYEVVEFGLAVVPAGMYWAFNIRKTYYWQGRLAYTTTLWWSPALKWTIRQWPEEPGKIARTGGFNWSLVSVSTKASQGD